MAIVRMTAQEARDYVEKNNDRLQAAYDAAEPVPFEDSGDPGVFIARGFAEFQEYWKKQEYLKKNARPKVEEPNVSITIRMPQSYATELRAIGRGWQRRTSDYLVRGIKRGVFDRVST